IRRQSINAIQALMERSMLSQEFMCDGVVPGLFHIYQSGVGAFQSNDLRMECVQLEYSLLKDYGKSVKSTASQETRQQNSQDYGGLEEKTVVLGGTVIFELQLVRVAVILEYPISGFRISEASESI
uniref:DUF3395 domain-containing protein n=1 Tax=Caenorhabditis tropicalis TaxID=1561998 RepID=A0A1I7SXF6_9PELO